MARSRRPAGLPDFDYPPLVEVALSIQFDALSVMEFIDLGPAWTQLRRRYPKVEEHPPLPPAFEIFGMPAGPPFVQLQLSSMPSLPRLWFVNEAGTEVLQVQTDRFIHNWRKAGEESEYPRYERIRRTFLSEFLRLSRIIGKRLGRELTPNQCEITYVNHIPQEEAAGALEFFRMPDEFPGGAMEDVTTQIRFVLPGPYGHPAGRLIAQAGPAVTRAGARVFQFMLTVRGRPSTADLTGAREFMDMGRAAIVNSFAALTTDRMHKTWGRRK
jgi:uncharacterized protein (TIGR04255 family)